MALEAQAAAKIYRLEVERISQAIDVLLGNAGVAPNALKPGTVAESASADTSLQAVRQGTPETVSEGVPPAPRRRKVQEGPQCPACGSYGTVNHEMVQLKDRMFPAWVCYECKHQVMG